KPEPAITSAAAGLASVLQSPICGRPSRSARFNRLTISSTALPRSSFASCGSGALSIHVHGVQRLTGGHEQPIAFRPAEAQVAAHFREPDAANQFSLRSPDGDA